MRIECSCDDLDINEELGSCNAYARGERCDSAESEPEPEIIAPLF